MSLATRRPTPVLDEPQEMVEQSEVASPRIGRRAGRLLAASLQMSLQHQGSPPPKRVMSHPSRLFELQAACPSMNHTVLSDGLPSSPRSTSRRAPSHERSPLPPEWRASREEVQCLPGATYQTVATCGTAEPPCRAAATTPCVADTFAAVEAPCAATRVPAATGPTSAHSPTVGRGVGRQLGEFLQPNGRLPPRRAMSHPARLDELQSFIEQAAGKDAEQPSSPLHERSRMSSRWGGLHESQALPRASLCEPHCSLNIRALAGCVEDSLPRPLGLTTALVPWAEEPGEGNDSLDSTSAAAKAPCAEGSWNGIPDIAPTPTTVTVVDFVEQHRHQRQQSPPIDCQ